MEFVELVASEEWNGMKCFLLFLLTTFLVSGRAGEIKGRVADEQAIRQTLLTFNKARDALDARGIANLFTPDGQFTTPIGISYSGRAAIQSFFAEAFQSPEMKANRYTRTVRGIRFQGPDVAIADVVGELRASGRFLRILEINLMTRRGETWLISSMYHMHLIEAIDQDEPKGTK
jgi:uncharacterized protein (TIGR02246 family)